MSLRCLARKRLLVTGCCQRVAARAVGNAPSTLGAEWEESAEISVRCPSGLVVSELMGEPALVLCGSGGDYRVRVSATGRSEGADLDYDEIDSIDPARPMERYLIETWPAPMAPRQLSGQLGDVCIDVVLPRAIDRVWPLIANLDITKDSAPNETAVGNEFLMSTYDHAVDGFVGTDGQILCRSTDLTEPTRVAMTWAWMRTVQPHARLEPPAILPTQPSRYSRIASPTASIDSTVIGSRTSCTCAAPASAIARRWSASSDTSTGRTSRFRLASPMRRPAPAGICTNTAAVASTSPRARPACSDASSTRARTAAKPSTLLPY